MSDQGEKWGAAWRDSVVETLSWKLDDKLHGLAVQALKRTPDRVTLAELGIGVLLGDRGIWGRSPNKSTLGIAEDALKKWKLASLESKARNPTDGAKTSVAPLRGMKAKTFLETVDALEVWVGDVDSLSPPKNVCRKMAITLALRGFLDWRHLEGVEPSECKTWCSTSSQNALIERCVIAANHAARRQARKRDAAEFRGGSHG